MQEHAGKIHVESEPGVGTAFQLEFPASGARTATISDAQEFERKTIHA
jgi:signal transduction histidine kinase